jgi:hypothetical protein
MTYDRVDIPAEVVPQNRSFNSVLHSAHHRAQLTVYLRLLKRAVLPSYGPTADVSWSGADPTLTVRSAERGRPR